MMVKKNKKKTCRIKVRKRGEEKRMNVSGKAHTLAILSLGSLTAAVIAVENLMLSETS